MKNEKIWIVGKHRGGSIGHAVWDMNGAFDSEDKAIDACDNRPDYFVGPLILNESLPDETGTWPGMYYPAHGKEQR